MSHTITATNANTHANTHANAHANSSHMYGGAMNIPHVMAVPPMPQVSKGIDMWLTSFSLWLSHSFSISPSLTLSHTHTLSLSLPFSHTPTHTHTYFLSLSLSHTHFLQHSLSYKHTLSFPNCHSKSSQQPLTVAMAMVYSMIMQVIDNSQELE